MRTLLSKLAPIFLAVVCLAGCNTNDNPTTADQMQKIRQKEAADRGNFKPTGAPPTTAETPSTTGK